MNAHLITIGDEILIGQIVDTNSAWMSQQLNLAGIEVNGITSVSDTRHGILEGLAFAVADADIILMTGGLGPTKDDITKKVLAEYFGVTLAFSDPMWTHVTQFFQQLGRKPKAAHRAQCFVPQNATLLHNAVGTAPGMWMEQGGKVFVSMPGVPYEMKYLMQHEVLPRLQERFVTEAILHRTIRTAGVGESDVAEAIEDIEDQLPPFIKLAYLPSLGEVKLRLTARGATEAELLAPLQDAVQAIEARIPRWIYAQGKTTIAEAIGALCRQKSVTIGTLESCTGGSIASRITSIPGASAYFMGSIVAYSNDIKMQLLDVSPATLEQYGAVSAETVTEMVKGGCARLGVDYAIAVSGIAGPDGGTPDKPVGTIWVGVGTAHDVKTYLLQGGNDRDKNIKRTVTVGLNLLRRYILKNC